MNEDELKWLLSRLENGFRKFLLEVTELRCDDGSTIFCTRYRQKEWHARLGGNYFC